MTTQAMKRLRKIIRMPVVVDHTGLSAAEIYKRQAAGTFPRSVAIGPNSRGWIEDEVAKWIEDRIAARDLGTDEDERIVSEWIAQGRQDLKAAAIAASATATAAAATAAELRPLLEQPKPAKQRAARAKPQARTAEATEQVAA